MHIKMRTFALYITRMEDNIPNKYVYRMTETNHRLLCRWTGLTVTGGSGGGGGRLLPGGEGRGRDIVFSVLNLLVGSGISDTSNSCDDPLITFVKKLSILACLNHFSSAPKSDSSHCHQKNSALLWTEVKCGWWCVTNPWLYSNGE